MGRLARRLLTLCSAVSLGFCVIFVIMWLTFDGPLYVSHGPQYALHLDDRGRLVFCRWGEWCVRAPFWLLILGTAVLPAVREHRTGSCRGSGPLPTGCCGCAGGSARPLRNVRLRPPRHAGPLSRMRDGTPQAPASAAPPPG